jgi:hypothetical protein
LTQGEAREIEAKWGGAIKGAARKAKAPAPKGKRR